MSISPQQFPDDEVVPADPDALLAALPALLGFPPEESLVLLAFTDRGRLIATIRIDLDLDEQGRPDLEMRRQLTKLGGVAARYEGVVGTVAVRVDAESGPDAPRDYRTFFRMVDRAFGPAGGLSAGFALPAVVAGARWFHCFAPMIPEVPFLWPPEASGLLSDPALSAVALSRAVRSGRQVCADRTEIAGQLAPLPHCADRPCRARTPIVRPAPPGPADARRCRLILDQLEHGTGELSCDRMNALAEAISSVHARDLLLALALTDRRDAAEDLWRVLARRLDGRAGAAAATLLGHLHYMAGEGVYAGAALDRALEHDPDYHLARLLNTALFHGLRPSELADVNDFSVTLADQLDVALPPRTHRPAG
ncbi:DUF4192 domain-containing protein [Gordonia sp. VNK21]|uniref:DUF4192 domain-containing protein n=1 Tax=Gordonia sp. VNK21 TaxID=3382483 RepID=UPI0038D3B491